MAANGGAACAAQACCNGPGPSHTELRGKNTSFKSFLINLFTMYVLYTILFPFADCLEDLSTNGIVTAENNIDSIYGRPSVFTCPSDLAGGFSSGLTTDICSALRKRFERFIVQSQPILGAPPRSPQQENSAFETSVVNVAAAIVVVEPSQPFFSQAPSIPTCLSDLTGGFSSGLTADICSALRKRFERFIVQSQPVLGAPPRSPQQENSAFETSVVNAAAAIVVVEPSQPFFSQAPSILTCLSDLTGGFSSGLTADICSALRKRFERFIVQGQPVRGAPSSSPQQENAAIDVVSAAAAIVVVEPSHPFSSQAPSIPTCLSDLTGGFSSGLTADICSALRKMFERFLVQCQPVRGAPPRSPRQEDAAIETPVGSAAAAIVVVEPSQPFFSQAPVLPLMVLPFSKMQPAPHLTKSFLGRPPLSKAQDGA